MDSVKRSSVTPGRSRLARAFAKVLHIRAATGITPDDGISKIKSNTELKNSLEKIFQSTAFDDEHEKLQNRAVMEAFLAKLFASVSAIKASYALLQHSQSPYDPDGIQSADDVVVSELKKLSELKQCYLKKQFDDETSPGTTQMVSEIEEQKNLLKTYEIMGYKLDSQLKLKDSEITFLTEKLEEAKKENKLLEKRLNSSGSLSAVENLHLSGLTPNHFIAFLKQTVKSIRVFVRLLISEMESVGWDLDAAASSIEPGFTFWKPNHRCFAFESFVCREMFDGFNYPYFSKSKESLPAQNTRRQEFFDRFTELKSVKATDYLAWKPKSSFAKFCRAKYSRLVHPKLEESIFGNLDQRNLINSGEFPETAFFSTFADMAKRVWLLHCLAFAFNPVASIFQVSKGSRFSEVYMESVNDEAFIVSSDGSAEPQVAFTVVPGFRISKTVIQCRVLAMIAWTDVYGW